MGKIGRRAMPLRREIVRARLVRPGHQRWPPHGGRCDLRLFLSSVLSPHKANVSRPPQLCKAEGGEAARLRPAVAVIHAQQADRTGNVLLWGWGILGVQKVVAEEDTLWPTFPATGAPGLARNRSICIPPI